MANKTLKIGKLEGAPEWYGTPFDKLHFEWSREEKLELERYCEKVLKNIAEEEMTPKQRFLATFQGKDKDRLLFDGNYMVPFATRTLDHWSDAIKPGDIYKRPKLHVKMHLAMLARYKIDVIDVYTISYAENFFGADAKMLDYGTPMILGDPPIKTMEDVESTELPDPFKHGLFPGYLWSVKELQSILKQYGADKSIPIVVSYCGGPLGTCCMGNMMMSMPAFMKAVSKQPELAKAVYNLASQWSIKYGKAVKSLKPDGIYVCDIAGSTPAATTAWMMDYYTMIGRAVRGGDPTPYHWMQQGSTGLVTWIPLFTERGTIAPDAFDGWWIGHAYPYEKFYEAAREHDYYCVCSATSDTKMVEGDWEYLENDIRLKAAAAKRYPKHGLAFGVVDYWTPPENLDKCLAWIKKYGRF